MKIDAFVFSGSKLRTTATLFPDVWGFRFLKISSTRALKSTGSEVAAEATASFMVFRSIGFANVKAASAAVENALADSSWSKLWINATLGEPTRETATVTASHFGSAAEESPLTESIFERLSRSSVEVAEESSEAEPKPAKGKSAVASLDTRRSFIESKFFTQIVTAHPSPSWRPSESVFASSSVAGELKRFLTRGRTSFLEAVLLLSWASLTSFK